MIKGKASAPAKVILFGEHFVVYGSPAILTSINRRVVVNARTIEQSKVAISSDIGVAGEYNSSGFKATKGGMKARTMLDPLHSAVTRILSEAEDRKTGIEIDISSGVPPGIGLGSSAAACVATVAATNSLFQKNPSRKKICKLAIESERLIHKDSSGADCYVSTFGGLIHFSKSRGFTLIKAKGELMILIASTGVKRSTGDLVAHVKKFRDNKQLLFKDFTKQAADICGQAWCAIECGNHDKLGDLMNENQVILRRLGVSHHKVDDLIDICGKAGALGVKMTGAGGGGAVIALAASRQDSAKMASLTKAAGYDSFEVKIDHEGLIV